MGEEAYGLSIAAVDDFAKEGGTLIITVDCGISNHEEVTRAAAAGIDVIICDHHKLQAESPPEAIAVIDPKIAGCGYPFRDLAGAGVAYKLACALRFARTALYKQSVALLSIAREEAGSRARTLQNRSLEASQPCGRPGVSPRPSRKAPPGHQAVIDKLAKIPPRAARFSSGKSKSRPGASRIVFGPNVDIESYDIADEVAALFPPVRR